TVDLGYVVLFPGLFISGTFIWIESLVIAWRQRDLPSIAAAAWNTYAEVHNTYSAIDGIGDAMQSVGSLFTDADDVDDIKGAVAVVAVLIVVAALAGGVLTTDVIRRHYAGSRPLPDRAVPQPARAA
ncbi:MAG: hypothetical protein JO032_12115, partial [Alphaproteobacteria bacterium]|nr:hypothetical protein [Alphaproteobacteria bacterium]